MLSSVYAPKDFKRLRVSGDLVARCFDYITPHIKAGISTGEIDRMVAEFLKANGVAVNKTMVYRNLDKMTEKGQLIKHKSMICDGFVYQSVEDEHHCEEHIHFQCCKCGSVIHLDDQKTSEYLKSISNELGLKIDLNLSSLNGICQKCRTQS